MGFASEVSAALEMVTEDITIHSQSTPGTYSPATGLVTSASETDYSAQGVFTHYDARMVDGSVIRSGDLACEVPAANLGVIPQPDDSVTRDSNSTRMKVVSVQERTIQGEVVSYRIQVRGNG